MSIAEIEKLDIAERIILVEEIRDSIARDNDSITLGDKEKKILDALILR